MKKLLQRRRRKKGGEGIKLHWELCLPRLLLIQSWPSTGHSATGCSLGLTRELNWTEVCLVQSALTWWCKIYPKLKPSLQLIIYFLIKEALLSVYLHLWINSIPQREDEPKSWTLVELTAWDTPVCISPDICWRSYCTRTVCGQDFLKSSVTFLFLYFIK